MHKSIVRAINQLKDAKFWLFDASKETQDVESGSELWACCRDLDNMINELNDFLPKDEDESEEE